MTERHSPRAFAEVFARWEARRVEHQRLGSLVSAEAIISDVLNDLHELEDSTNTATCSLTEAAKETGYHPGSLARMIKERRVTNYGTKTRPRVRVSELPRKTPHAVGAAGTRTQLPVSSSDADNAIVLAVIASRMNRPRSA